MIEDNSLLQPIRLTVNSNAALALFIGVLHGGALLLLLQTSLAPLWLLAGGFSLMLHGGIKLYRYRPGHPERVSEILLTSGEHGSGEQWWLRCSGMPGEWLAAELQGDALIHPRLLLLGFRSRRGEDRVVIVADSSNADAHRRLRVRLRQPLD